MRKTTGIRLLRSQIDKINDESIKRVEWIATTNSILLKVFPVSSQAKIIQIDNLEETPEFFNDISPLKRIELRKLKAKRYLENYIEEIDLLGTESNPNKIEGFLSNFRFW